MFSFSLCSIDQNIPIICKYEAFFFEVLQKVSGAFFSKLRSIKTKTVVHSYYSPLLEKITLMAVIIIRKIQNKGF